MRDLTDDLIKSVASGYGMDVSNINSSVSGSLSQVRAMMEWARDEARAATIREFLLRDQKATYGRRVTMTVGETEVIRSDSHESES